MNVCEEMFKVISSILGNIVHQHEFQASKKVLNGPRMVTRYYYKYLWPNEYESHPRLHSRFFSSLLRLMQRKLDPSVNEGREENLSSLPRGLLTDKTFAKMF